MKKDERYGWDAVYKCAGLCIAILAISLGGAWFYHGVAPQAGLGWPMVAMMLVVAYQLWTYP